MSLDDSDSSTSDCSTESESLLTDDEEVPCVADQLMALCGGVDTDESDSEDSDGSTEGTSGEEGGEEPLVAHKAVQEQPAAEPQSAFVADRAAEPTARPERKMNRSRFIGRHKADAAVAKERSQTLANVSDDRPRGWTGTAAPERERSGSSLLSDASQQVPSTLKEAFQLYARTSSCAGTLQAVDAGVLHVNDAISDRNTLLHMACRKGDLVFCQELLKRDANPNVVAKKSLSTPLHLVAAADENLLLVKELLRANANVHAVDVNGFTALHLAAEAGAVRNAHQLLCYGAKAGVLSVLSSSPASLAARNHPLAFIEMACKEKHLKLAELILVAWPPGEALFNPGKDGDSAPILACKNTCTEECMHWLACFKAMVAQDVEVLRLTDGDGMTPLAYVLQSTASMFTRSHLFALIIDAAYSAKTRSLDLRAMRLSGLPPQLLSAIRSRQPREVDLRDNCLDAVPLPSLESLRGIEKVLLDGNPLCVIPPNLRSNWPKLLQYLDDTTARALSFRDRKVMLVGEEGAGKTTLVRCINSKSGRTANDVNLATDGIEITENILIGGEDEDLSTSSGLVAPAAFGLRRLTRVMNFLPQADFRVTAWDLGGQSVFYPSHQFFLTSDNVYLVVFNLAEPKMSRVEYWIRLLRSLAWSSGPDSPTTRGLAVFLVGTHADDPACTPQHVQDVTRSLQDLFPRSQFPFLSGIVFTSSSTGQGISELKQSLAQQFQRASIEVKERWVLLFDFVQRKRAEYDWLAMATFYRWCSEFGVTGMDEKAAVLRFLSNTGLVTHLSNINSNSDLIILQPQWLADVMTSIITIKPSWVKHGVLDQEHVRNAFQNFPAEVHDTLLDLMEQFGIIFHMRKTDNVPNRFIIPSLLPDEADLDQFRHFWPAQRQESVVEQAKVFRFPFLPIVHLLQISQLQGVLFWKKGAIVKLQTAKISRSLKMSYGGMATYHLGLVYFDDVTCEMHVHIRSGLSMEELLGQEAPAETANATPPEKFLSRAGLIARLISDSMVTLLENYNMSQSVSRLVKCSHCLDQVVREPSDRADTGDVQSLISRTSGAYLFTYYEILTAIKAGRGFIFCNHMRTPTRMVSINSLAPDLAFVDMCALHPCALVLEDCIGSGAFGKVYKGTLTLVDGSTVTVAAKELVLAMDDDAVSSSEADRMDAESSFEEFQQEALLMSALHDDNLVQFYGILRHPTLQIVMEYVPKGDLYSLLHPKVEQPDVAEAIGAPQHTLRDTIARDDLPWRLRLLIAWDVAKGMMCLHSMDPPVVHRDLRSPNIFLSSLSLNPEDVRAKVADFGMSRRVAAPMTAALATFRWVAPETFSMHTRRNYDERSDIYSFAICCWELASRAFPYDEYIVGGDADTDGVKFEAHQLLVEIAGGMRPSPPPASEGCPPAFWQLIQDCWAADPQDRPSFSAIVDRLTAMLSLEEAVAKAQRASCVTKWTTPTLTRTPEEADLSATEAPAVPVKNAVEGKLVRSRKVTETAEHFEEIVRRDATLSVATSGKVTSIAVINDLYLWVGCSDGLILIFDTRTGEREHVCRWKAHRGAVTSIVPSPDQALTAEDCAAWSTSADGSLALWSYRGAVLGFSTLRRQCEPFASFMPDADQACVGVKGCVVGREGGRRVEWVFSDSTVSSVLVLDENCVQLLHFVDRLADVATMEYVGSGQIWLSAGRSVFVYSMETIERLAEWVAHKEPIVAIVPVGPSRVSDEGPPPGTRHIWTMDAGGRYKVWSIKGSSIALEYSSGVIVGGATITSAQPVRGQMWIGYDNGTIILCSLSTFKPLHEFTEHEGGIATIVSCNNQGTIALACGDRRIGLWKFARPKVASQLKALATPSTRVTVPDRPQSPSSWMRAANDQPTRHASPRRCPVLQERPTRTQSAQ